MHLDMLQYDILQPKKLQSFHFVFKTLHSLHLFSLKNIPTISSTSIKKLMKVNLRK